MPAWNASRARGIALRALGAWLAGVLGAQAAQVQPGDSAFSASADVLSSDFRSDTLDLAGNVRVTQGAMSIEANTAQAQDFRSDRSRWTFRDAVRIRTADAQLLSDSASAAVVDGEIADARVQGSPAKFEQLNERAERRVRGQAGLIEYDFTKGIVKLTGQVWFSNGKDEFRGDVVIYNVRDERVQINPDGRSPGRVRGTIRPRERTGASLHSSPNGAARAPNESGA